MKQDQTPRVFIERRTGQDRRQEPDTCADLPVDLYHRKRRKNRDRRTPGRDRAQDMAAFYASLLEAAEPDLH